MPSLLRELIIIATLVAVGMGYSLFNGLAPLPWVEPALEVGEIRLVDAEVIDPLWIDARAEDDYTAGHIDGALSLNEANWETHLVELIGAWLESPRPIVVYCASESCGTSKRIAERLRSNLPDAEIYSLHGGWSQ
jgi:rhodanese-related sulfurtransferase